MTEINRQTGRWSLLLFLGSFLFMQMSCLEEDAPFTAAERKHMDTTVMNQTKLIRVEVDSICDQEFDVQVELVIDSILQKRLAEIRQILGQ